MIDSLGAFLSLYPAGKLLEGTLTLLTSPNATYDDWDRVHPLAPPLLNAVDSMAFGNTHEACLANQYLQSLIEDPQLLHQLKTDELLLILKTIDVDRCRQELHHAKGLIDPDLLPLLLAEKQGIELKDEQLDEASEKNPSPRRDLFIKQLRHGRQLLRFRSLFPDFSNHLERGIGVFSKPYLPLCYKGTELSFELLDSCKGTPVIMMEPWTTVCGELLERISLDEPAILLFPDANAFLHTLQFPELLELLQRPSIAFLILTLYPHTQIALQPQLCKFPGPLVPIDLGGRQTVKDYEDLIVETLDSVRIQSPECFGEDSPTGNALYRLGWNIHDAARTYLLGKHRAIPFWRRRNDRIWHDRHKGITRPGVDLGPTISNPYHDALSALIPESPRRSPKSSGKQRIAHVVPQVVDGGHAPSNLLNTLLEHHDHNRYELTVFSTEQIAFRPMEYPYGLHCSPSSAERGITFLRKWESEGIHVFVEDATLSFLETARRIAKGLQQLKIDIAVFHGPDPINTLCASITDVPLTVMFEHGTPALAGEFNLQILSADDTAIQHATTFEAMRSKVAVVPHVVDPRTKWEPDPTPLTRIGLPEGVQVMTTISNHLEKRLSPPMVGAIADILKKVPNAVYAPIGWLHDPDHFRRLFDEQGVGSQVYPLGIQPNPSQLARSMHLYLNEFPFGSGLAILDAMAAGLPIISMHDPDGPPQASNGATFYSEDRVVKTGNPQDYTDLAISLLKDQNKYNEWSSFAIKKFEERTNLRRYVSELEAVMEENLQNYSSQKT